MSYSQFEYTVQNGDSYTTIAKKIINEDKDYDQFIIDEDFVEKVGNGIGIYLHHKALQEGKTITLIKETSYYLSLRKLTTKQDYLEKSCKSPVNALVAHDPHLYFSVKYFKTYEAYYWRKFYKNKDYGEVGITADSFTVGDRSETEELKAGYVYIFNKDKKLTYVYEAADSEYQRVSVTESNPSYKKIGSKKKYMTIRNFFTGNYRTGLDHYIIVSKIKLSVRRLFNKKSKKVQIDVEKRGMRIGGMDKNRMNEAKEDTRSGPQILKDFRESRLPGPDIITYNLLCTEFGDKSGFTFLFCKPLDELKRRAELFQKRFEKYRNWINNEKNVQESFIYNAVNGMIKKDPGMKGYIDINEFEKWRKNYSEEYRQHYFPVHYAIKNLLGWLASDLLNETLNDYIFGTDDEKDTADKTYAIGIKYLVFIKEGAEFLSKEYDKKYSYISLSLVLKPEYFNDDKALNTIITIRKWNNIAFEVLDHIGPIIIYKEGHEALSRIISLIKERTGHILSLVKKNPLPHINYSVNVADVKKFLSKTGTIKDRTGGKMLINFLELVNLCIAIKGMFDKDANLVDACINVLGATVDFAANNWLIDECLLNRIGKNFGKKVAGKFVTRFNLALNLISGVIDCYLGLKGASKALASGEIGVFIGWGAFALGGAFIAVGAGTKLAATYVTAGSGGTASFVGGVCLVIGVVLEGIGLLLVTYFENRDIKEWLKNCRFGKRKNYDLKGQIQKLNDILCDFKVSAQFKDIEYKLTNETQVTLIIEPRTITKYSKIKFSRIVGIGKIRFEEVLFGNHKDHVSGLAGTQKPDFIINEHPRYVRIITNNQKIIEKIEIDTYYKMDIDEVEGTITLSINNGTLQGLTKNFKISAALWEGL